MKIKQFIKELKGYNQEAEVFVGSDEELNIVYSDVETSYLTGYENQDTDNSKVVIWGNSGSEVEESQEEKEVIDEIKWKQ